MPSDDAYHEVLAELGKLATAWQQHREVINRAVGLLSKEILEVRDQFDDDRKDRVERQRDHDAWRSRTEDLLDDLKRWSLARLAVELGLVIIVCGMLFALVYFYARGTL